MAKLEGELSKGSYVKIVDLPHPRKKDGNVFGRILHIEGDVATLVVPHDLGYGYAVKRNVSKVEMWDMEKIPIGQMHFLRL
jgi:hypothetical protein